MGCDTYVIRGHKNEQLVHFSDACESGCVCTFPYNDAFDERLDGETVTSLALLGATVAMIHHEALVEEWSYIPECLPEWIIKEIKKHIIT